MAILLNGGSDPRYIDFNGTDLSKVIYNGTTVWEKFPQSISSVRVYTSYYDFTVTNLTKVSEYPGKTAYPHGFAWYSGSVSGTISEGGTQLLKIQSGSSYYGIIQHSNSSPTVVGLPHSSELFAFNSNDTSLAPNQSGAGYNKQCVASCLVTQSIEGTSAYMNFWPQLYLSTSYRMRLDGDTSDYGLLSLRSSRTFTVSNGTISGTATIGIM